MIISNPLFQLGAKQLPPGAPSHGRGFGFPYAARYLTLLIFLNTPEDGGNTTFPLVGTNPMRTTTAGSTPNLRDVMGRFGNVNPNALGLWQSHDLQCDGADGHLSIAPVAGDAVLFYNHHVVRHPLVCYTDFLSTQCITRLVWRELLLAIAFAAVYGKPLVQASFAGLTCATLLFVGKR